MSNAIKTLLLSAIIVMAACLYSVVAAPQVQAATNDSFDIQQTDKALKAENCSKPYAQLNSENCGIIRYIVVATNILSGLVGVIIVAMITYGGIRYSTAGANPQAVAEARKIIIRAITALFLYIFGFALVQWLVPGGIF